MLKMWVVCCRDSMDANWRLFGMYTSRQEARDMATAIRHHGWARFAKYQKADRNDPDYLLLIAREDS